MSNIRIVQRLSSLTGPADDYRLTAWLFLRLLGLVYFAAFFSLTGQITGLVGSTGILPVGELLSAAHQAVGRDAWWRIPTLLWIYDGDSFLVALAIAGCVLSLLLFLAIGKTLTLVALFVLYLSLQTAGQVFLNFQWDYLLLETGVLAIFLQRGPTRLLLLLFHWLLFRLRFLSGVSKLLSGDPSWSSLTALSYYFESQPLPHMGAWFAHQLPVWLLETDPFAGDPPHFLRVLVYRYRFTDAGERKVSGNIWQRTYLGEFPQVAPRRP